MVWNQSYLSLAVVLLFLGMAVQPAVAGPNLNDIPDETDARDGRELAAPFRELAGLVAALKADTTDPTDSDSDGLPDSVEWVIGTDPLNNDTDFDQINDSREIELQLDPNEIDSNRDGLADYFETGNVSLDLDGDGVANAWDWDNDNDGVVDSIDLSPFAKTDTYSNFSQLQRQADLCRPPAEDQEPRQHEAHQSGLELARGQPGPDAGSGQFRGGRDRHPDASIQDRYRAGPARIGRLRNVRERPDCISPAGPGL